MRSVLILFACVTALATPRAAAVGLTRSRLPVKMTRLVVAPAGARGRGANQP